MSEAPEIPGTPVPANVLIGAVSNAEWMENLDTESAYKMGREFLNAVQNVTPYGVESGHSVFENYYYYAGKSREARMVSFRAADIIAVFDEVAPGLKNEIRAVITEAAVEYLASDAARDAETLVPLEPIKPGSLGPR